jgi:hypothetical protein
MRRLSSFVAASALISSALLLAQPALAMPIGTGAVPGIQQAVTGIDAVESVVYICTHQWNTSRRVCRPAPRNGRPLTCHHIRSTSARDCY